MTKTNAVVRTFRLSTTLSVEAVAARQQVLVLLKAVKKMKLGPLGVPLESLIYLSELQLLFPGTAEGKCSFFSVFLILKDF